MDIGEMFRSFFGLRNAGRGSYFPPGPDSDDEYHDDCCDCEESHHGEEFPFFFGHGNSNLDDMFHHFHNDMHQQMESIHRQMEDMMKGFGTIASEQFPPVEGPRIEDNPTSHPNKRGGTFFFSLPESGHERKEEPRDFMLKDGVDSKPETLPSVPAPEDRDSFSFRFRSPFGSFPRSQPIQDQKKEDTDLDGKVSKADVMDLIKKSDVERKPERQSPSHHLGIFSGQSVTMSTVRGPNGKTETHRVVKDSSGREESTVTRVIDGQTHSVTTVTGPEGVVERRENFQNMDENDVNKFEEKWQSQQTPRQPIQPHQPLHPQPPMLRPPHRDLAPGDMDIFSKFFGDPRK